MRQDMHEVASRGDAECLKPFGKACDGSDTPLQFHGCVLLDQRVVVIEDECPTGSSEKCC